MPDQTTDKLERLDGKSLKPSAMVLIEKELLKAKNLSDISDAINLFNTRRPYQTVHLGICSLDGVPVKQTLHSCPIRGLSVSMDDFEEELKWGICRESERLKPFDLLTHEFETIDTIKFEAIRKKCADMGLKQIIIVPMKVKNTITLVTNNFPLGDFEDYASEFLPQLFQTVLAIFERFPKLLLWPQAGKLTPREAEILTLSANGLTEAVIAVQCGISVNTVRNHVENSKVKLNARNKLHAVMIAAETHEIDPISDV